MMMTILLIITSGDWPQNLVGVNLNYGKTYKTEDKKLQINPEGGTESSWALKCLNAAAAS